MRWTEAEHALFEIGLNLYGRGNWVSIAQHVGTRNWFQVKNHYFRKLKSAGVAAALPKAPAAEHATGTQHAADVSVSPIRAHSVWLTSLKA
jgi:hypothetical protein